MTNGAKNHQAPVCPSCGEPVRFGFLHFKISEKVKMLLVVLLIGYAILSVFISAVMLPPELRRHCNYYDSQHRPDYCKDTEFTLWVRPLNKDPALQIFVGSGLAIGILVFYWDWLQNLYENWQRKQGKVVQKREKIYKYKCCNCGQQWN
jgi:hypothetical protein